MIPTQWYDLSELARSNWHIHTNFSPCASDEMTVPNILACARASGLELIALVDHHHSRNHDILKDIASVKKEVDATQTETRVIVGAELSAFGVGKYSDSIDTNCQIDFRLYACNHYHLNFWEHPEDRSPRGYAEHILAVLTHLLKSRRADCIAHPFVGKYLKGQLEDHTTVTKAISDQELAEIFELGKNNNVAWEMNTKIISEDIPFLRRCWNVGREVGVTFYLGSDAHMLSEIDMGMGAQEFISIFGQHE